MESSLKEFSFNKRMKMLTYFTENIIGEWEEGPGNKKYRVRLYTNGTPWKTVTFGDKNYQQYQDKTPLRLYQNMDHLDESRRQSYQARHGAQGYQNIPFSPAWFSWNYLW